VSERRSTRCSAHTRVSTLLFLWATMVISAHTQTFTKLLDLTPTTGEFPASPLVQGLDGNLYGTTSNAGAYGGGTFFQLTPSGTLSVLYDFCFNDNNNCPDGAEPAGSIVLAPDGSFYGTTKGSFTGGEDSTIYNITSAGSLTTLHTFCGFVSCSGAFASSGGLTLAGNGNLYGTSNPPDGSSAYDNLVYSMTPSGTVQTRLKVCPNQICPTNAGPFGTLLQASGGYLIGPGPGGTNGVGAIYKMSPLGTPSILYSNCVDSACHGGISTNTPLVQNAAGNLFGTNLAGGGGPHCTISQGCGTAFQLVGTAFTVLHPFCNWLNCLDGGRPTALIQGSDGNFYGATSSFGAHNGGVIFKVTNTHQYTVLHAFATADGTVPQAALMQATDGTLYGTTTQGGNQQGTIFKISLGLPAFVKTVQPAGKVGDSIVILGNGLTGSSSVTFNGAAATFTVVSDTEITATVPSGATTGSIQVVTPSRTLFSLVNFPIHP
jgi:uncharacterized repeat protein (TIGR03803 family)